MADHYNVLFLCTGNSARSIMAEALLNHKGKERFVAYSAGRRPAGAPRPEALAELQTSGIDTAGLRSKSWDEFAGPNAPHFDFIFMVGDAATAETCPVWPGHPVTANWAIPDRARATGSPEQIARAFHEAFTLLDRRINLLLALPLTELDALATEQNLQQIGGVA